MKKVIIHLCCLFFLVTVISSTSYAQQVFKTTKTPSVIGYMEYLPKDYHNNSKKYPLVIFLHGKGEIGPGGKDPNVLKNGVAKLTKIGPPKHAKNGTDFPFIMISPQLKSGGGDWSAAYVMEVLNYVKTYLRVDTRRIYLTGLSLGGGATWWIAQDYPDVFAAIAPVCGSRNSVQKACNIAKSNLPVWAFHGSKDNLIPLGKSERMVAAINACSAKTKAKLTVYPGVKHGAWENAYKPDHSIHRQNVYDWLLSHSRGGSSEDSNNENQTPVISAGADKEITLPANVVSLISNGGKNFKSYAWRKVSGGNASLQGANSATLKATGLKEGKYVFRITAKNSQDISSSDDVVVTVKASAANKNPVAKAGGNATITLPANSVTLRGSGTDGDGKIVSYAWTKLSGPGAALRGANSPSLTAGGLREGKYTFKFTVKDNKGASASDYVDVFVKAAVKNNKPNHNSGNRAPVVYAGHDITISLPANSLNIAGSARDTDGKVTALQWTKIVGGAVNMYNSTSTALKLSNLREGFYIFRLTAKDDKGVVRHDDMAVRVRAAQNHKTR